MATLTFHGGVGEIGGNRILVEDGRGRLLLDFGTSFSLQGRYFHEFLNPRKGNGIGDYLRMGLAPDLPGLYRQDYRGRIGLPPEAPGADAVLVTHAHVDHIGLIPLLRPDIPLAMSKGARIILDTLQTTGSAGLSDYLQFFEDFRIRQNQKGGFSKTTRRDESPVPRPVLDQAGPEAGGIRIHAHDVDHSLPGARGYVVETRDASIAYTGDFRFHGRNEAASRRFAQRLGGVDVLVTEGTNMGVERPQDRTHDIPEAMSEADVEQRIADAVIREEGFVAVNYPVRDLDRILSFWRAARRAGRRLLLTTKQAWMLQRFHQEGWDVPSLDDPNLGVYIPRKAWGLLENAELAAAAPNLRDSEYELFERGFLDHKAARTAAQVRQEPTGYMVYVDLFNMTELIDLAPKGGSYIYSKTEAFNDEMEIDAWRLSNWLNAFNLTMVKAHASGHASRQELEHMIDAAKPRRILPVHTLNVKAFEDLYGDRVTRVALGQEITL